MSNCQDCEKKLWRSTNVVCEACAEVRRNARQEKQEAAQVRASSIIITTETSQSLPVASRLGVVTGECVLGLNAIKDFLVGGRDLIGGRSETMQKAMKDAKNHAIRDMQAEAEALGADAVVAVRLDYQNLTMATGAMVVATATGTAVTLTAGSGLLEISDAF